MLLEPLEKQRDHANIHPTMLIVSRRELTALSLRPQLLCAITATATATSAVSLISTSTYATLSPKARTITFFNNNPPYPLPKLVSTSSTTRSFVKSRSVSSRMSAEETHDGDFVLTVTSTLKIKKGDITQWFVDGSSDAIVNPANERMLGGGGADGAIHRAAGPELKDACFKVPEVRPAIRCPTGEARITPGFKLPAAHVIHTVGPIYDVDVNPQESLRNAYKNSLEVAKENNIQYIAFPAISCGVYGYPFEEAATIAISTVKESANDFKEVHFVLFSDDIYNVWLNKAKELLKA